MATVRQADQRRAARRRRCRVLTLALAALLLAPALASAQSSPQPIGPWDGQNPFNCVLQDAGTGTDFPDPDADPFCVEYDKTSQNVTDFGLVDFLSKEPARVAAATPKCFYFQHDHWTGSIVQGSDPELWNWDGSYFFDRAKGIGGVHVTNFRVGGQPFDGTPYAPPEYHPYMEPTGGGGVILLMESGPDPVCAARVDTPEEREEVYRDEPRFKRCISPGGQIRGRRIGKVRLGMSRDRVVSRIGAPRQRKRFVHRWCVVGGSSLRVAFRKRESASRRGAPRGVALVRTTNPGHSVRRIGPGSRRGRAVRKLGLRSPFKLRGNEVFTAERKRRYRLLVAIRGKRVRWLAIADPHRLPGGRIRTALRNAG